jgi:hypothetical protein
LKLAEGLRGFEYRYGKEFDVRAAEIIGGVGTESLVEYYLPIIASYRKQKHDGDYHSIISNCDGERDHSYLCGKSVR